MVAVASRKRVGILGSAFDPPHIGHVAMIHAALETAALDEVWLVPCPMRYDKTPNATDKMRLEMCRILSEELNSKGIPVFHTDLELTFPEFRGTYYLFQELSKRYPAHTFSLIMGEDAWNTIHTWKNPANQKLTGQLLLQAFETIVFPRNQNTVQTAHDLISKKTRFMPPLTQYQSLIKLRIDKEKAFKVSSTLVRKLSQEKGYPALEGYIPSCILEYITQNRLYR